MIISMIAAMGENNEIGSNNDIPWHLPDDYRYFKETTSGFPIIMGRKNYFSLPDNFRPLPNRINMVLTSDEHLELPEEVLVFHSIPEVMAYCKKQGYPEIFVIGGGQIYAEFMDDADRLLITEINGAFDHADTYFPPIVKEHWKEAWRKHHPKDEKHHYSFDFVEYRRP